MESKSAPVKKFETAKDVFTLGILWATVILILGVMCVPDAEADGLPFYLIMGASAGFLLWILFDTGYAVGGGFLYYRSGPFRGKIRISSIRKIEHNDGFIKSSLLKPGLGRRGFTIWYSGYEDIFVSPKDKDAFLRALKAENESIQVVG